MNTVRGRAFAWLAHPVTVAALALLIVNDHVLKAACPGWVTGKLSDAAGMVVAPPLLAALAGLVAPRRRVTVGAILAVGVGFTFVKMWSYGAELASSAWSLVTPSLVRADPTDLLALPFLAVAWWTAKRPPKPAPRWLRAMRLAVFLPLALAGVAATSAVPTPAAIHVYLGADGAMYLGADTLKGSLAWVATRDGRTFDPSSEPVGTTSPQCSLAAPVTCYRVVPERMAVEIRTGTGPWQESWGPTEKQMDELYDAYPDRGSFRLESESLAVLDVPGGHVVAVANRRDGFAVREVDGTWRRIGFPTMPDDPAPVEFGKEAAGMFTFVLVVLLGGLLLSAVPAWRAHRRGNPHVWWLLLAQVCCGGPVLWIAFDAMRKHDPVTSFGVTGSVLVFLSASTCTALAMAFAWAGRTSVRDS
ncbi:hypothetical protein [Actinoplanes italicus]|nr:hypothetical protein [Actinoplanes italicus]